MRTSTSTNTRPGALLAALSAACLVLAAGAATAGVVQPARALQDPTRPPAAATDSLAEAPKDAAAPQLQSVLLDRGGLAGGGRRIAVIDGESVRVGERFRGARVLRIADNEVELLRGGEHQVLRLYAPAADGGMTRVGVPTQRRAQGQP